MIKLWNTTEEYKILDILSSQIPPGSSLMVSYVHDYETFKALELGVPPPITRLGFILFNLGHTWFKDFYFPEGFREGEQKLQAQKPIDEYQFIRNVKEIIKEILEFERISRDSTDPLILDALKRSFEVKKALSKFI